jgi:hypothetical protein
MFKALPKSELKNLPQGSFTIVVPFRDQPEQNRMTQLMKFNEAFDKLGWTVLVVEQSDDGKKFNRGALLNVGYDLSLIHI